MKNKFGTTLRARFFDKHLGVSCLRDSQNWGLQSYTVMKWLFCDERTVLPDGPSSHLVDEQAFEAARARAGVIEVTPPNKHNNVYPIRDPLLSIDWLIRNLHHFDNEVPSSDITRRVAQVQAFSHQRQLHWLKLILINVLLRPREEHTLCGLIEDILFGISVEVVKGKRLPPINFRNSPTMEEEHREITKATLQEYMDFGSMIKMGRVRDFAPKVYEAMNISPLLMMSKIDKDHFISDMTHKNHERVHYFMKMESFLKALHGLKPPIYLGKEDIVHAWHSFRLHPRAAERQVHEFDGYLWKILGYCFGDSGAPMHINLFMDLVIVPARWIFNINHSRVNDDFCLLQKDFSRRSPSSPTPG